MKFQLIHTDLLKTFEQSITAKVTKCFEQLKNQNLTIEDFKNYMTAGAVASSQIEGSTLNLNSFYQSKQNRTNIKEVAEIEDLISGYEYAKENTLNEKNLLHCHKLITASFTNILKTHKGKYRKQPVGIRGWSGLIYLAIEPENVQTEMNKFFADITTLQNEKLTFEQTLYYASYIHFLFAKIHPFADGNGRTARLLEKMFLAEKLGVNVWGVPTEKYYFDNRPTYYDCINVGVNYYETLERLNNILPFLNLLPKAVCYKPKD